ncbi:MAG: hypothetical protein ACRDS9_05710 [Pseudonocardiaceae bacterium]
MKLQVGPGEPPEMGEPPIAGIIDNDDPWIAGYLKLRQAVLTGELKHWMRSPPTPPSYDVAFPTPLHHHQ